MAGRDYVAPRRHPGDPAAGRGAPPDARGRRRARRGGAGARHGRGGAHGVSTTTVRPEPPVLSAADAAEGRPRARPVGPGRRLGSTRSAGCADAFAAGGRPSLPRTDTSALTQRNVYIVPTRPGFTLRRHAAGDDGGRHQLPAQPGLRADLPAGRRGGGGHARYPRHAARSDAAPEAAERRCTPAKRAVEVRDDQPRHERHAPARTRSTRRARRWRRGRCAAGPRLEPTCRARAKVSRHVSLAARRGAAGRRAALIAEDPLPTRPLSRLDGLVPGGARAGVAGPETPPPPLPLADARAGDASAPAAVASTGELDGVRGPPARDPMKLGGMEKSRQGAGHRLSDL